MILYLAAEIYALRIKTQDNILNSIQSTKNVGNKLQVETLSDGVAQEFAIQYVSVSHGHMRDLARVNINTDLSNLCNVE